MPFLCEFIFDNYSLIVYSDYNKNLPPMSSRMKQLNLNFSGRHGDGVK